MCLDSFGRRLDHLPGLLGGEAGNLGSCAAREGSCAGGAEMGARLLDVHPARHGGPSGCGLSGLRGEGDCLQLQGCVRQVLHGPRCSGLDAEPRRGGRLPPPHTRHLQGGAAASLADSQERRESRDVQVREPHGRVQGNSSGLGRPRHERLRSAGLLHAARPRGRRHAPLLAEALHNQRCCPPGRHPSLPQQCWGRGLRRAGHGRAPGLPGMHGHAHLGLPLRRAGRLDRGGRDPGGGVRWRPEGVGGWQRPGASGPGGGLWNLDEVVLGLRLLREPARRHLRRRRQSSHRGQRLQALGRRAKGHRHGRAPPALRLPAAQDLQRLSRRVRDEQV
mmetsp:Transcript_65397/g.191379  ORF Transcript_65397/g.191379 Transcript_65397/m.191379 type:complete len:334 (-) Transcript_65397:616-1617(-)